MGYNIEKIRERYNADFVFSTENENIYKTGIIGYTDEIIKQTVVVLKQSLDAAGVSNMDRIEYQNDKKKMVFFLKDNSFYGILVDKSINIDGIDFAIVSEKPVVREEEAEDKTGKVKVVLKDKKKIVVKGPLKEEKLEKEEIPRKEEPVYKIDSNTFNNLKKIAHEFLEDFSDDIITNIVNEMKLDLNNLNQSKLDDFLKRFSKASSMIIGPSQSQKMVNKIIEILK